MEEYFRPKVRKSYGADAFSPVGTVPEQLFSSPTSPDYLFYTFQPRVRVPSSVHFVQEHRPGPSAGVAAAVHSDPMTSSPIHERSPTTRRPPLQIPSTSRSYPAIPSTSRQRQMVSFPFPLSPIEPPYGAALTQWSTQSPHLIYRSPETSVRSPHLLDVAGIRTPSPARSAQAQVSSGFETPSPGCLRKSTEGSTRSPHHLDVPIIITPPSPRQTGSPYAASSSGRSMQSLGRGTLSPVMSPQHRRTPSPSSPTESPHTGTPSPDRPTESPEPITPFPLPRRRPRAQRRLFRSPSPFRPELETPSRPWEVAFGHQIYRSPPMPFLPSAGPPSPIHSVRGLPLSTRQTISPESSSVPKSRLLINPDFSPQDRYFYASPGMVPQLVVTGDSFIDDQNVPPEFRGHVPPFNVDEVFPSRGIPENRQEGVLTDRFYEEEYKKCLEELKILTRRFIPQINFREERSPQIIIKTLENHFGRLHIENQTLREEKNAVLRRAVEQINKAESEGMQHTNHLNDVIKDLEVRLVAEAKDNSKQVEKQIQLQAEVRSLREKLDEPVVVMPREYEQYEWNVEMDEMRARNQTLEAENNELRRKLDSEKVKYERLLKYILEAHQKIYEICEIKHREFYAPNTVPSLAVTDPQRSPRLGLTAALREIALMAEAFTRGEAPPSPEVARRALDQWHDLITAEMDRDNKYLTELAYQKVAYSEAALKGLQERDQILKFDLDVTHKIRKSENDLRLKKENWNSLVRKIKEVESNIKRASEYYKDIQNLWENCKYKYLSAVRKQGLSVYYDKGQWIPAFPSPEIELPEVFTNAEEQYYVLTGRRRHL